MVKTFKFKLFHAKRNKKLHNKINIAGLIYNHCIALHKRYWHLYHKSLNLYEYAVCHTNFLLIFNRKLLNLSDFMFFILERNCKSPRLKSWDEIIGRALSIYRSFCKTTVRQQETLVTQESNDFSRWRMSTPSLWDLPLSTSLVTLFSYLAKRRAYKKCKCVFLRCDNLLETVY